ncbi:MAG: DegT/DnrJ/EryC1/StrS family aminotransferase, partial [Proteobacteria bacterium]|nr:DegT/DnrJ/EryC1/StrS family aminotransferase [Pseudomonadota bacterium]
MFFRALPPSGVCIRLTDILAGFQAAMQGEKALLFFRDDICQYFGVRHAFLTSSGRAALSVLLSAFQSLYPDKNEVALPAYTSFSVPSAVVNAGLKVSLYDLDGSTLSPDLQSLGDCITDKTLCIVICHLYGYPCDMDGIKKIAAEKGIPVIDDAAQAMGAMYKGRFAGTLGTAGIYSLSRGKNITAVDGGIIVTDDERLAEVLYKINLPQPSGTDRLSVVLKAFILSFLLHPRIYWFPQLLPFLHIGASVFNPCFEKQGVTSFQAGIGRKMLGRLAEINRKRKVIAGAFCSKLNGVGHFVSQVDGAEPVYLRLPVLNITGMKRENLELGVVKSYPLPLDVIM